MTLRTRFLLYLVVVHVVFAAVACWFLWQHRIWLIVVEAFFALSAFVGYKLVRGLFEPIRLLRSGAQFMNEGDFTTRFLETGAPELDGLVHIYNRMVDHLRDERVRSEEQQNFLRRVIDASPSGIVTLDFDARIAQINPSAARLLGREAGKLAGTRLDELATDFADALHALDVGESRIVAFGGRRRVKCHKSDFFDRGFPRTFIMMEELSEELRRSEKSAYEKLIRMMSHEVNNTTGSVSSLLESCLRYEEQLAESDRADYRQALAVAIRRSGHMNQFMKRFADVVRLPPPRKQEVDVREMIAGTLRLLEVEAQSKGIRLSSQLDTLPSRLRMDPAQMEQALINILRNAFDAIGQNGEVRILGQTSRGEAPSGTTHPIKASHARSTLIIEDSGPGFSAEVRENLFMPFYTTKEDGQGIGLTLVAEILDAHGFEFSLESSHGQPTRFTVVID